MDPFEVHATVSAGRTLEVAGHKLDPEEVLITAGDRVGFSVASEGGYSVAIETKLTTELLAEGTAREIVHRIQNLRRLLALTSQTHIDTYYFADGGLASVMEEHEDYVSRETLSDRLIPSVPPQGAHTETVTINGEDLTIGLVRVMERAQI